MRKAEQRKADNETINSVCSTRMTWQSRSASICLRLSFKCSRKLIAQMLSLFCLTIAITTPVSAEESYFQKGNNLHNQGQYELAASMYTTWLASHPNDEVANYSRGLTYQILGQFAKAIADYDKAIALKPDYTPAYNNRGNSYASLGQLDKAIADFDRAIALAPDEPAVYYNRGDSYKVLGQLDKAIADYDKAIALKPDYLDAYNNRGNAYNELGQFDKAIADFDRVIALKPDRVLNAYTYNNRGNSYEGLGQLDKAIADYDRAIALAPDVPNVYYNRAVSYNSLGQFDKAISDCDKAIALKPDYSNAYDNRAVSYNNLGQFDKAIADCDRAIALKPDYSDAYNNRAISYNNLGQFDKAIADCDRAIALKPDHKFAYINRGEALARCKRLTESFQDFERAFPRNNTNWYFYKARSVAHFISGDKSKGIADIEKALALAALAGSNMEAKSDATRIKNEFTAQTIPVAVTKPKETQTEKKPAPTNTSPSVSKQNNDRPIADKWALVVGISQFKNSKYDLKFAAKDASDFYNYLVTEGNFKRDHVLLLLNQNATKDNIMTAFGDKFLPAVAQPDDLVVIFVSTHGTPKNKDQGKRNYIVAHDTDINRLYATGVNMDELYARVKEAVNTDRALIVMDTCYSGGGVPGAKAMADSANFDANEIAQGCGHLVITSSAPNERSWESTVSPNGVFTKYLLQALRKNKGDLKNAFTDLQTKVSWEVKSAFNATQSPQLGGNWEGKDLLLSVPARQPRQLFNKELLDMMHQSAQGNANLTKPATSPARSSPPGKK